MASSTWEPCEYFNSWLGSEHHGVEQPKLRSDTSMAPEVQISPNKNGCELVGLWRAMTHFLWKIFALLFAAPASRYLPRCLRPRELERVLRLSPRHVRRGCATEADETPHLYEVLLAAKRLQRPDSEVVAVSLALQSYGLSQPSQRQVWRPSFM